MHGNTAKKCGGAGDRDRTGMTSLEGWGSTIELHPRDQPKLDWESVTTPRWSANIRPD